MGKVVAQAIMSLDGYVAKRDNTIGRLFDWLQNGDVEIPTPAADFDVHLTPPSSEHWRTWVSSLGALVCGRTLFDVTDGWHGRHTLDVPVVVVTHHMPTNWIAAHPDAPFSFVTTGSRPRSRSRGRSPVTLTSRSPAGRSPGSASTSDCSTRWPSTSCPS